jgi:glutamate synthase (NADPH/NADH) small chain
LARAGHTVAVYERSDRIGGLLRYGIPEFKMEKRHLDQRLAQLTAEGVKFRPNTEVGVDITGADLRRRYDAIIVAAGATSWRELDVPGRDLAGVHQAMEYLPWANRVQEGDLPDSPIDVQGAHVVIIGGGDTGADCLGTAHRQGAASVTQLEIMPRPPEERPGSQPWPTYPMVYRTSSAHEEGGDRMFSVSTERFIGENGRVTAMELVDVEMRDGTFVPVEGSRRRIPADYVFLAMGFVGPERGSLAEQLGLEFDSRGALARHDDYSTDVEGVFVAGDAGRGQSLIVWAIAEGRAAAASVDRYLMGSTNLPSPIRASARPVTVS